ncbi:MAG: DUF4394 domain-containing protein [Cyanobacteria bacterium CRU_2_1]|nr:DUF4394 domain-containing protein [Cyanobacteria bacterium RU_5_0]NJR61583.1 DUF4394 domain-containing protein [Cyanobacteria bacterium CRU_2_1]
MPSDKSKISAKARPLNQVGLLDSLETFSDSFAPSNGTIRYRFRLSSSSTFQSSLSGLSGNGASLELLGSNNRRIAFSNRPGRQSESISPRALEAGTYTIQLRRPGRSRIRYTLNLFATAAEPDLAGNDQASARAITVGATPSSFIDAVSPSDANDFYRVDLATSGNLSLNLSGLTGNANLRVLNNSGTEIGSSATADTASESLNLNLASGSYFVQVLQGASDVNTSYSLTASVTPLKLIGLGGNNTLLAFNPNNTNAVSVNVTGLGAGETLQDIDFRPLDQQLLGLSSSGQIYTIDAGTGVATRVGNPITLTAGARSSIDVNPVPNALRVVNDAEQNFRFVFATSILNTDPNLVYDTTDAANGQNPNIVSIAYSNNFARTPGATPVIPTTLYGIDSTRDALVIQGSTTGAPVNPNTGRLFTIGTLGIDFGQNVGFDIFTDTNRVDTAYATNGADLFNINLSTGVANRLGSVTVNGTATNVIGIAARLP